MVAPLAAYVPAVRSGSLVFTAGQLPMIDGALPLTGKVGAAVSAEDAKGLARTAALNGLAAVDALVGLDSVVRVVKVVGYVASNSVSSRVRPTHGTSRPKTVRARSAAPRSPTMQIPFAMSNTTDIDTPIPPMAPIVTAYRATASYDPVAKQLTVTPNGPHSSARVRVTMSTPAFAAQTCDCIAIGMKA